MTITLRAIKLAARDATELNELSYENGEVYYDQSNATLRLMNGDSTGGTRLATQPWVQNNLNTVSQAMSLLDTTQTSSPTTGALKVSGGAGIVKNLYVGQALNVAGSTTLQSTLSLADDLTIATNKFTVDAQTGNTQVAGTLNSSSDFTVNANRFTVNSTNGNTQVAGTLNSAGNFSVNTAKFTVDSATGTTYIDGDATVHATLSSGNLRIDTNTLSSTNTGGNIVLDPNGVGYVQINGTNALIIPSGTSAEQSPAVNGAIRLNTTYGQFEGYANGNWSSLGGVRSVDGQTYIVAETTPGSSDDTLQFFTATGASTNVRSATLDSTKLAILQTTPSTSTNDGALTVAGGVGIVGNVWAGGNLNITGTVESTGGATFKSGLTLSGSETPATEYFRVTNGAVSPLTKFLVDTASGNTTVSGTASVTGDFKVNTNKFTVSASSGDTVVAGTLTTTSNLQVGSYNGGFTVNANTGNVVVQGSLTTYGTAYQVGGGTTISDPLINLHTGTFTNNDGFDIGVYYDYYDTQARKGFFGRVNSSNYLEYLTNTTLVGGVFSGTYGTVKAGSYISTGDSLVQGNLAIGNITTASGNLHISTDSTASVYFDRYGNAPPNMIFRRANGTKASPTAVTLDNQLFALGGRGYGATGYSSGGRAAVYAAAAETWTDTAQGAYLGFTTTPTGSATAATVFRLETTGQAFFSAGITSTTSTTGTVKVTGGVGISENLNVGGTLKATTPSFATSLITASTSFDLLNTTVTTINFGSGATTLNIGATGGTTTIASAVTISGALTESSSITLKENVNPITGALDLIKRLEGVTYDRRNGSAKNEAGLIAEAVDKVIPNIVKHDSNGNPEGINYTKLTAYLIEAVKELTEKVERLSK